MEHTSCSYYKPLPEDFWFNQPWVDHAIADITRMQDLSVNMMVTWNFEEVKSFNLAVLYTLIHLIATVSRMIITILKVNVDPWYSSIDLQAIIAVTCKLADNIVDSIAAWLGHY